MTAVLSPVSDAIDEREPARETDWLALARELGPLFASRAAAYDPLQAKRQHRFTGRVMLGLDPVR